MGGVGESAGQRPRSRREGGVHGYPNIHTSKSSFGTYTTEVKKSSEKFAHQLRLPLAKVQPGGQVSGQFVFCIFHPFLNCPQRY